MTLTALSDPALKADFGSPQSPPLEVIFGSTGLMRDVRRSIELVASTDAPVLLQGESGTGKELCARLIHSLSHYVRGDFVKVNCPAIPPSLMGTELFGYERGAFSGADSPRKGRMDQAQHGTLVLDGIESLDTSLQSKLLQILQDGTFFRVGGRHPQKVSARIISISSHNLRHRAESGTFRLDFLYRINTATINLPSLRQRRADIPQLVEYFASRYTQILGLPHRIIPKGVVQLMQAYDWPGNIWQLENMVRSYMLIGNEKLLVSELTSRSIHCDEIVAEIDVSKPLALKQITKTATRDLERQIILKVLQTNHWNRQRTAKWLQISYRSLLYKLSEIGIHELHHVFPADLAGTERTESSSFAGSSDM